MHETNGEDRNGQALGSNFLSINAQFMSSPIELEEFGGPQS